MAFGLEDGAVVLDKSYLQAVNGDQLRSLCQQNVVVVPQILVFDLLNKTDDARRRCLEKLHSAEALLRVTPAVGEMMRHEIELQQPAQSQLKLKVCGIRQNPKSNRDGSQYIPSLGEQRAVEYDRLEVEATQSDMFEAWRLINGYFPELGRCEKSRLPAIIESIARDSQ